MPSIPSKTNPLSASALQHVQALLDLLGGFDEKESEEVLHHVRVKIKKLRAIASLWHHAGLISKKRQRSVGLKNLFRDAGSIRLIQLRLRLPVLSEACAEALRDQLKAEEHQQTRRFRKKLSLYIKSADRLLQQHVLPEQRPEKNGTQSFFTQKMEEAETLLGHRANRRGLHEFRKILKKILYAGEALPRREQKALGLDFDYLNRLQAMAGDWHDIALALEWIKKEFPKELELHKTLNAQEKKALKSFRTEARRFREKAYP